MRAENYIPVTLSFLLSRMFWGIIDQKLRKTVRFSPRQKGFVSEAGCFNNMHILSEVLRHAKNSKLDLVAVQLDVSKAFDTIPHSAIAPALRRKGLPELVVQFIARSYQDVHTVIKQGTEKIPLPLQRGVKQGDPLSPLIFNAVIEALLLRLKSELEYTISDTAGVSTLAFADDLFLLANKVP